MTPKPYRTPLRCTHIKVNGLQCGSPALRGEYFCYFHARMIKGVAARPDSRINSIALLEDEESIQVALMEVTNSLLRSQIDTRRASLILKALHIAVRNARRARFGLSPSEMVREVPDYAQQYRNEHPGAPALETATKLPAPSVPSNADSSAAPLIVPARSQSSPHTEATAVAAVHASNCALAECDSPARDCREAKPNIPDQSRQGRGPSNLASPENPATISPSPEPAPTTTLQTKPPISQPAVRKSPPTPPPPTPMPRRSTQSPELSFMPPLTTRQARQWDRLRDLEASVHDASRGDLKSLKAVFRAVGLTPPKPNGSGPTRD